MRKWSVSSFWVLVVLLAAAQMLGYLEALHLQLLDIRRQQWPAPNERHATAVAVMYYSVLAVQVAVIVAAAWPLWRSVLRHRRLTKGLAFGLVAVHALLVLGSFRIWQGLSGEAPKSIWFFLGLAAVVLLVIDAAVYGIVWWVGRHAAAGSTRTRRGARLALGVFVLAGLAWSSAHNAYVFELPVSDRLPAAAKLDKPNVFLVVLDTLRADCLAAYGGRADLMPNLNRFAEDSVVFERAISPGGWTLPAHASLFTGLFQVQHGVGYGHEFLDEFFDTLAEILRDHGYQTAALNTNPLLAGDGGWAQGFQQWLAFGQWSSERKDLPQYLAEQISFHAQMRYGIRPDWGLVRHADPTLEKGAGELGRGLWRWFQRDYDPSKPFFLFLNYFEVHEPYAPPAATLRAALGATEGMRMMGMRPLLDERISRFMNHGPQLMSQEEKSAVKILYELEARYLDEQLAWLFRLLEKGHLLDKTLVVICSDHGEHLGEHGMLLHSNSLYEPIVAVPLLVRFPDPSIKPQRVSQRVQLTDVFWTVTRWCGIDIEPPPGLVARNLADLQSRGEWPDLAVSEYKHARLVPGAGHQGGRKLRAVYQEDWKHIQGEQAAIVEGQLRELPISELFDLRADPAEARNLDAAQPTRLAGMKETLAAWVRTGVQIAQKYLIQAMSAPSEVPETVRQRLRDLGYTQ